MPLKRSPSGNGNDLCDGFWSHSYYAVPNKSDCLSDLMVYPMNFDYAFDMLSWTKAALKVKWRFIHKCNVNWCIVISKNRGLINAFWSHLHRVALRESDRLSISTLYPMHFDHICIVVAIRESARLSITSVYPMNFDRIHILLRIAKVTDKAKWWYIRWRFMWLWLYTRKAKKEELGWSVALFVVVVGSLFFCLGDGNGIA